MEPLLKFMYTGDSDLKSVNVCKAFVEAAYYLSVGKATDFAEETLCRYVYKSQYSKQAILLHYVP